MYIFLDGLKAPTAVGVLCYGNLMGPSTIWFPHFGSQVYFSFNQTCIKSGKRHFGKKQFVCDLQAFLAQFFLFFSLMDSLARGPEDRP